jgi:multiple sugar transport system ATP-binding protein
MGAIRLENVKKSFGNIDVIPGVDLEINDGEFVVFVGPSGCGKSTLLRLIAGLEDVTSGKIMINDVDMVNESPAKRGLSMVFQSYALYPHMTVYKNMACLTNRCQTLTQPFASICALKLPACIRT